MSYIPNVVQRWDKGHWDVATWDGQTGVSPPATTFALTGFAAGLSKIGALSLLANTGTFTLTGYDAGLRATYLLAPAPSAFALTGQATGLSLSYVVGALPGALALTGNPVGLSKTGALSLLAAPGAFLLTGQDTGLSTVLAYALAVGPGAFALTGTAANLVYTASSGTVVTAARGVFTLSGSGATLQVERDLTIPPPGVLNFGRKVILIPGRW